MYLHTLKTILSAWILCFTLSSSAYATQTQMTHKANAYWQSQNNPTAIQEIHVKEMLQASFWLDIDPTWRNVTQSDIFIYPMGLRTVVRVEPRVQGLPVFGATRILTFSHGQLTYLSGLTNLKPLHTFKIDKHEALMNAHQASPKSLFIDPSVERISGITLQGWHAQPSGLLPVYKVRIPTLHLQDLHDLFIEGHTGKVYRVEPVARFSDGGIDHEALTDAGSTETTESQSDAGMPVETDAPNAHVFTHAPHPNGVDMDDLQEVRLKDLQSTEDGAPLNGWHFVTRNCCKHYTCNADLVDGLCPFENQVCTDETEGEGVILSELTFAIPADTLPSAISFLGFTGDTLHAKSVFCAELPRAKSHNADGKTGWYYDPVDKTRASSATDGLLSEEDAFAEVQVYHATQSFFTHIKGVMENDQFCLDALSMDCDEDGNSVLDDHGKPVLPYHITTNLLMPAFDLQALSAQLVSGLGQAEDTPVIINDFQRLGNAAFVPAMAGSPIDVPDELSTLTEVFSRPYDSNVYFQGDRDFSYDGDVVYHEFTHGLVHTLAYGLRSSGYDKYGTHAEPGAMNEGWADYFSVSFTNDPDTGEYAGKGLVGGETGIRSADNDHRCPDDLIGQVHEDSVPFSGALWDLRGAIEETYGTDGIHDYDQLILTAIAQAGMNETFGEHLQKVLELLETTFSAEMATTATTLFNNHNVLNCERVFSLVETEENGQASVNTKAMMMQPGAADVGLSFAPSVMQFKIQAPANTADITLLWEQDAGGGFAGFGGTDVTPLKVLVAETDSAIEWKYEGSSNTTPTPYFADGSGVPFDINATDLIAAVGSADAQTGRAPVNYAFETSSCEPHTFHVSILSTDAGATLHNIKALVDVDSKECGDEVSEDDDDDDDSADDDTDDSDANAPDAQGCGCHTTSSHQSAGTFTCLSLLGLISIRRLRRRRTLP